MRHLRLTVLAAFAVALLAPPVAGAHRPVITPAQGKLLGEGWAQLYALPLSENPLVGNGNPCLVVGHKVVQPVENVSCTVSQGTSIMLGFAPSWSNAEDPFPATEAEQRAVLRDFAQGFTAISVVVDGHTPVDIHRRRYELFSPQRTVRLPEDNILGVPQQTVTFTAYGWVVLVRNLRPGRHTIVSEAQYAGERWTNSRVVTVVPR
jgi:hypothetical protein